MPTDGFFLGGVASGIEDANKLGLLEQAQQQKDKQSLIVQADKNIADTMQVISDVVKESRRADVPADKVSAAVAPLLKDVQELAAATGRDPAHYVKQVQSLLTLPAKKEAGVSVNIDQRSMDSFSKALGEENAKRFVEQRGAALDAAKSLESAAEAKKLLNSGIIAGAGADYIVAAGKALQTIGFNVGKDAIANTEAFAASRAQEVGRIIKLFGSGTGLSDADREYATKAAAGQITLTEQSLRRILDINERASRNVIRTFNQDAKKVSPGSSPFPLEIPEPQTDQGIGTTKSGIKYRIIQ